VYHLGTRENGRWMVRRKGWGPARRAPSPSCCQSSA